VVFDHSAQVLPAPREGTIWETWVGEMLREGVLRQWGAVGTIRKGGKARARGEKEPPVYVGVGSRGMSNIPMFLARGLEVDRPKVGLSCCWCVVRAS
jgi:predicted NAD/FAD-dependent oxidoreductase